MSAFCLYNLGSTHGPFLQKAIDTNREADQCLADLRNMMVQMLDGDSALDASYATIQARFGFASVASAHAAFAVIDTVYAKMSGDAQVDHVRSARDQLYAQLTI